MSDSHGDSHAIEESKASGKSPSPMSDNIFERVLNYITTGIQRFVAFLFFLFTAGALYGIFITRASPAAQPFLLIAPAAVGLLAYYNRAFAIWAFVVLIVLAFIF
ncbi:MAG TPA: hypothetical protein VFF13_02240 [archaeon]|nr:hypothetical protein [archaeon]